jgi:hypothetical protein
MNSQSTNLNALRSISEKISFTVLLRISIAIDLSSSLYEVGVPIIVECQGAFVALRRNSAGYSKALAMRTRVLLVEPLPVMTISAAMN